MPTAFDGEGYRILHLVEPQVVQEAWSDGRRVPMFLMPIRQQVHPRVTQSAAAANDKPEEDSENFSSKPPAHDLLPEPDYGGAQDEPLLDYEDYDTGGDFDAGGDFDGIDTTINDIVPITSCTCKAVRCEKV